MAKTCLNHKDTPATTMCHQCHHPICKACTLVSPQGIFCSPECSILNRDVKSRLEEPGPKGMARLETLLKLLVAFVLILLGFGGIHMAAERVPKLKRMDVIGRLMDVFNRERLRD
jgi:hypothetical protein